VGRRKIGRQVAAVRTTAPDDRRWGVRRFIHVLVGCTVLATLTNTWVIQGLIVPAVVASGSMAPALVGPHRGWQCGSCRHEFVCSLETLRAPDAPAVCPNCGAENAAARGADVGGDRVLVDRSALLWRSPRRWETVAFRDPGDSSALCVKRVVGLPGECVEIQAGDVLIGGRRTTRHLAEQRAMAVIVYDTPANFRRWQAAADGSWELADGRAMHRARAAAHDVNWLTYHHEQVFNAGAPRGGPIVDESPSDQGESRALSSVSDIALACEALAFGDGEIHLRAGCRGDEFTARIDVASGRGELKHNDRTVARFDAPPRPLRTASWLELRLADHQAQLVLADRLLVQWNYEPSEDSPEKRSQILAIGARGADVELRRLRILRDIYYTPGPRGSQAKYRLGPDEYFMLGDNSPHAIDSRAWWPGGIPASSIVGKLLKW
jgi:signal peptidase I